MLILTIRTDRPEAEIGLFNDFQELDYVRWPAHRQLAESIHLRIADTLKAQDKDWQAIEGIVCYKGPGSFTGLRIGLTVGNTLSYGLSVPIVASNGEAWLQTGCQRLIAGENEQLAMPEYGAPVHITLPKS